MIIENMQIAGFGCISGEYNFSGGLNIVLGDNEAGKTTLADAITALLYGLAHTCKKNANPYFMRDYQPVGGGVFAGSLIVCTDDGRRLNIWRDFAVGQVRVLELLSGKDVTSEFAAPPNGDSVGESLTGLSYRQYQKLAFLSQDELNNNWDFAEFTEALSLMFSTGDMEGVGLEKAKTLLEDSVNNYAGITSKGRLKAETEIKRLKDKLSAIDVEIAEIEHVFRTVESRFEQAADKQQVSYKISETIKKYDYCICVLQRREVRSKLEERETARKSLAACEQEIIDLTALKSFGFADIEHITHLMTLLNDKNERAAGITSVKDVKTDNLQYFEKRVKNLGKRERVSQEYLLRVEQAIAVLESNLGRERSVRIDCRNADMMLTESGIDVDKLRRFTAWKREHKDVEVEFVVNYERILEQIEGKENRLKNEMQQQMHLINDINAVRMYSYKFSRNNLILGCVFTGLSVFFFVAMGFLPFMLIPAVACLGWSVFAAVRLVGVQRLRAGDEDTATGEIMRLQALLAGFAEKYSKMDEKLNLFAGDIGLGKDELLSFIHKIAHSQKEVDSWGQRLDRHLEIETIIADSYTMLKNVFCEIGIADASTELDITRARVLMREITEALSLIEQYQQLRGELDALVEQESELLGDIYTLKAELDDIFAEAGVEVIAGNFEEALILYKKRVEQLRHLHHLETEALPALMKSAGDITEIERLESDIEIWDNRISKMEQDDPWLQECEPELSILEYGQEIKLARLRLEDTQGELVTCEKELAVEHGRKRERLPVLVDEREEAVIALQKAERFNASISLALAVFADIGKELHSRWSPLFSEEFNTLVSRFSSRLEFSLSQDLSLCAVERASGLPVASEDIAGYLSKGMRDQAYLSLRLLLSQRVAKDESIPVILDDPFINADDSRFIAGMEELREFAAEKQIFVFTCHQLRHEQLCRDYPDYSEALFEL